MCSSTYCIKTLFKPWEPATVPCTGGRTTSNIRCASVCQNWKKRAIKGRTRRRQLCSSAAAFFKIVICAPRAPQSVFARCKPLQTDKRFFLFLCSTSRFSPVHAYCSGDIKMMRVLKDNDNLIIIYDNLDLLLFITDLALKKGFCRHRQLLLQGISTVTINILKPNLQSKMCYLCSYS